MKNKNLRKKDNPPWGRWSVIHEEKGFKVKKIEILPEKRLSYQKHFKRAEHWEIVRGKGTITIEGKNYILKEGECITIPKNALHRIENIGPEVLVIIEVQRGEYLGEDDIVRVEDDFGRG